MEVNVLLTGLIVGLVFAFVRLVDAFHIDDDLRGDAQRPLVFALQEHVRRQARLLNQRRPTVLVRLNLIHQLPSRLPRRETLLRSDPFQGTTLQPAELQFSHAGCSSSCAAVISFEHQSRSPRTRFADRRRELTEAATLAQSEHPVDRRSDLDQFSQSQHLLSERFESQNRPNLFSSISPSHAASSCQPC